MSFDLNILVNGNRCKQYQHEGKTFIEAKEGSEYVIEIKNSHSKRILAVGSVDGLNILTGKPANEKDSGYIIGAYSAEKIKGFRYSDDEWAMFKFGYKFNGKTYAQSKGDGSERNCGVIGLRMFYEKEPLYTYATPTITWNTTPQWLTSAPTCVPNVITTTVTNTYATASYSISNINAISAAFAVTGAATNNTVNYCCSNLGTEDLKADKVDYQSLFGGTGVKSTPPDVTKGGSSKMSKPRRSAGGGQSAGIACASAPKTSLISANSNVGGLYGQARYGYTPDTAADTTDWMECDKERTPEFDMGTEWGRKERSKVKNVPFERGCLAQSFDIYYASRESLIAMGVPITNELQVGLPQSFPNGYAQPPAGWVG